ncbi:MAG: N-carbamoylputrescine amidase, partial [Hyphomonadaceae bacterium]
MTSPRIVKAASIQSSYGHDMDANIAKTIGFVREAAAQGANIILPSELFQGIYFCTTQDERWFKTAYPAQAHPCVVAMQKIAKELGVVIPVSIFEKDGPRYYNSIAIIDADGANLGTYRKSHIPDGPGYQ